MGEVVESPPHAAGRGAAHPLSARRLLPIDLILGLAVTAVVLLTWLPRLTGPIDLRWDGGVYYVLGTSLAQGRGYRLLNEPGHIAAAQYPPLFPAVIAVHQILAGTDDATVVGRWLRMTFLLLSILLALATYVLLRNYGAAVWAFLGACVVMLHTATVFVSDIAFAEVPYAFSTVLFFVLAKRRSSAAGETLAGVLVIVSYLLRASGIALVIAWAAEGLLHHQLRRAVIRLALVLPAILGWQLYVGMVERQYRQTAPSYAYQRADYLFYNVSYARNLRLADPNRPEEGHLSPAGLLRRLARNVSRVPLRLGETVSTASANWRRYVKQVPRVSVWGGASRLTRLVLLLLGGAVLLGLVAQFIRGDYAMPLYVILYIGTVCATPWMLFERYWVPIAPMAIVAVVHFFRMFAGLTWTTRVWTRGLVAAAAAVVLLVQVMTLVLFFRERHQPVAYIDRRGGAVSHRLFYYRDTYRGFDVALDVLRDQATPDAIVASSMPHWVYIRTGLRSVMPPFERDPGRALELLEGVPVNYLVVDDRSGSFSRVYGLPAVQQAPTRWESVFTDRKAGVETFRRVKQ